MFSLRALIRGGGPKNGLMPRGKHIAPSGCVAGPSIRWPVTDYHAPTSSSRFPDCPPALSTCSASSSKGLRRSSGTWNSASASDRVRVYRWKAVPGWHRPARPRRCRSEARLIHADCGVERGHVGCGCRLRHVQPPRPPVHQGWSLCPGAPCRHGTAPRKCSSQHSHSPAGLRLR